MKPRITTTILVLSLLLALASWEQVRGVKARVMPATLMAALTVTNTNDDGAGSLRQAIMDAAPGDTIDFAVTGTITLTSPLGIGKNLTINGPGAAQVTISGNRLYKGFSISSGAAVAINNLTVANSGDRFAGGGINNGGNLTLTNCTISNNYTASNGVLGGGIYNSGTATIIGCTISGNSAGNGGAIANEGTLIVSDSTLSGNSASSGGGGIYNFLGSSLTMTDCTLSANTGERGGGIYMYFGGVTLTNCTFAGNSVSGSGGGIYNKGSEGSPLYATNCTFTGNSASEGGGIYNEGITGIKNTIIAGNSASSAINGPDLRTIQPVASFGNNLIGTTSGGSGNGPINLTGDTASVISNQNPQLGPLANNGGATKTCALLSCSPATNNGANVATLNGAVDDSATTINVADATFFPGEVGFAIQIDNEQMIVTGKSGNQLTVTRAANSTAAAAHNSGAGVNPAFDQRGAGFSRQFGSAVDIGAFERTGEGCPSTIVTNGNDSGPGSLRDALANAGAGSTITFVNGIGQITLTSTELVISRNVTISGPGANLLTISGNGARRVFTVNSGFPVVFEGLTIANGAAGGDIGGGILNYGNLTIRNSAISGNATSSSGGGIYNANGANLVLLNSTLSGNSCSSGGGIYNGIAGATLTNCTLSGNYASNSGGAIVMCGSGTMVLTNCTISGNIARDGGGIFTCLGSIFYIRNTMIAGNTATGLTPIPDFHGQITSQGYNLIGNNSGGTITPTTGDLIGTPSAPINPLLGPLADNGGPTQTHMLLAGSPAIDAGSAVTDPTTNQPLTADQRGFTRLRDLSVSNASGGDGSDIGAFELQNDHLTINPDSLPNGAVGSPYTQTLNVTGGSGNYLFVLKSGNLPTGLTLSSDGQISGTPPGFGMYTFTVLVTDNTIIDARAERNYSIRITPPSITPPCATAPYGLVAWWRGEGNANDRVGSNHGTLNGSATFSTLAEGYDGRAFKFDGTNGYVALPDNLFPFPTSGTGATPFSFELWFKSAASGGVILGQQTVSPYNTLAGYVPAIYVGTDGKLRVEMFNNGARNPLVSANTVNDNLFFHHVAVTYDGTQQKVYLDGQLMGSRAHTQIGYSSSYKYQLGTGAASGWPGGTSGWFNFNGLIDEPSLYNRALTDQEVLAIFSAYNGGKCVSCPTITATVVGDSSVCTGGFATVYVIISGGVAPYTVTLNNEGETVTGSGPVLVFIVSPTATTTYAVQSASDANGCAVESTGSATVTVTPTESTPTITPGGIASFCQGGSVTLTSSSATGNQWYLDGSPIDGATAQQYVATASGSYTVVVSAGDCSSAASAATTVTVNPIPATPTVAPGGPTSFCAGGSVTLTSSSSSGNQWYKDGNAISGATGQTYNATASGNYTVVVMTSDCPSAASAATSVTANPITATPTISAGGPTTFCTGGSVTLTSSSASGNQWYLDGSPINGATGQSYVASAAGDYRVVVTTSGCQSAPSAATTVMFNPATTITMQPVGQTVNVGQSVTFSVTASGVGLSYQWRKGTANLNGAMSSSYTIPSVSTADAGTYSVVVTGQCGSRTSSGAMLTVSGGIVKADTTTIVTSSSNPATLGSPVSFTAFVSPTTTGTVQFTIDGVNFGPAVALVNGAAGSGSISSLTFGTHTVRATFSGNASYNGSSSNVINQLINLMGLYTTYGNGGWGAEPNGNNAGALLATNFSRVYGNKGVKVGGTKTLTFTSATAVKNFLATSGTPGVLTTSQTNPTAATSAGVFAGQVLALRLNVDFANAGLLPGGVANLKMASGPLMNQTVTQVLTLANTVLGGNTAALPAGMSVADLNQILTQLNQNFNNGITDNGVLKP